MADREELTGAVDPGGDSYNNYDTWGGGEERGVWGGKNARRDDSAYTGGWHDGGSGIPVPNDPEAYRQSLQYSSSGRQEDVDRYRQMGADAQGRGGVSLDYTKANENFRRAELDRARAGQARQQQQEVAGVMKSAAMGAQPSRAEILGRSMIGQSLQAQLAGASSARGGALGQASAQRQAQQGAAGFQQQGMNQLSALRADEMERARSAWGQQVGNIRGQDYAGAQQAAGMAGQQAQMAQAQGNLVMDQRRLNQAAQMGYEEMAWNTNKAALDAGIHRTDQEQANVQFSQQMDQADEDRAQRDRGAVVGAVGAGGSAAINAGTRPPTYSDMRAKVPLLLDVGKKPKAAAPSFLSRYMDEQSARKDNEHAREEHDERMADIVQPHQDIDRSDPYAGRTPGGIQREDPYGSGETFFSDEKAKRSVPMNWEENDRQDFKERKLRDPKDVKRKYEDKAGKDADDLMASFKTSLDKGPSVGRLVADYDADEPKDERMAYMVSDERAKRAAFESGAAYATKHLTGEEMTPWGGGEEKADEPQAKFEPAPHPNPLPDPPPPPMKGGYRSPERYRGPSEDRLYSGNPDAPAHLRPPPEPEKAIGFSAKRPAGDAVADANRSMAGSAYAYKPGLTPPEQTPGEPNFGPMAQSMEKSPVAGTAIKVDPITGLRVIDKDKALKVTMAGVADLQRQNDEMRRTMQRRSPGSTGRKR